MRRGVTLIELLIVILIMLMIAAVTMPIIRPALEGRKIREAARIVEVFLNGARNRALQSGKTVGVIFETNRNEPSAVVSLAYAEQPDPYSGDFQGSRICLLGNGGFGVWQIPPHNDALGNFAPGVIATNDSIFTLGDNGWVNNLSPGDLFHLNNDDTTRYRIFAGEPYIDGNESGSYELGERFNDVDGSGDYTPPNAAYINPATGAFISIPQIVWGSQSAFVTYTYEDNFVASQKMNEKGSYSYYVYDPMTMQNTLFYTQLPIYLSTAAVDPRIPFYRFPASSVDPSNANTPDFSLEFQFIRRPVRLSASVANLPDGTCVDLGSNYAHSSGSIVGIPGSGFDMLAPFSTSGGGATLGFFSTFRPNPLADHEIVGDTVAAGRFNGQLMICFDQTGAVEGVYSYDERNFIKTMTATSTPLDTSDYRWRYPLSTIYLLVGQSELIDGSPERIKTLESGSTPKEPVFNFQDPSSIWVGIIPRSGLISSSENNPPDLTVAAPQTQTSTNPQLQLYLNAQVYAARALARQAMEMGK